MDSGLTAEDSCVFSVGWSEELSAPSAEVVVDTEKAIAYIRPYCEDYTAVYYKVTRSYNKYIATTEVIDEVWGAELEGVFTTTGEQVYSGIIEDDAEVYYYEALTGELTTDVTLSIYRRETDGTFTEIATGLENKAGSYVTDPHPALDYARYRIVATSTATGTVSYYDVPGVSVGESSIVIQWDEEWFNPDTSDSEDLLAETPWTGSMIKLPYNVDVTENASPEVGLVSYIGREHPVAYYGTQKNIGATWNADIEKTNTDLLHALRRLAIWSGDVYVREPSGTGYWANITIQFSQKHRELTIPVSLDIVRVEGGV